MLEQQYMEQCYQKLLEAGYPEDRIIKDYRLLEGLRTDFAILPPGLNSLPMIIIEVKHNLNTGNKWLKTDHAKKIQKDFDLHCYVYCAEDNLFIDIESSEVNKPIDKILSYDELQDIWLQSRTYISSLQLENFMLFKSAEFHFGSKLNIIIGENGSGKTQLMKLLYAIARSFVYVPSRKEDRIDYSRLELDKTFGVRNISELISYSIKEKSKETKIVFSLSGQGEKTEFQIKNNPKDTLIYPAFHSLETLFSIHHNSNNAVFLPTNELLSIFPGFMSMQQVYRDNWPYDQTYVDTIKYLGLPPIQSQGKLYKELIQEVEKAIHGHIYLNEQGTRFLMQMEKSKTILEIPIVDTGWRKMGQLLQLINTGLIYPGSILLWDEPDANLNPKLICLVAKVLLKLSLAGVQVFIATHSLFLLRELEYLSHEQNATDSIRYIALGEEGVEQSDNTADLHNILSFEEEIKQEDRIIAWGKRKDTK